MSTIGSGGTYPTWAGWHAALGSADDTGTCISSTNLQSAATLTLSATGHAYVLTADASNRVNAFTRSAATSKARGLVSGDNLLIVTGSTFTIEYVGILTDGNKYGIDFQTTGTVRRCGFVGAGSGTSNFGLKSTGASAHTVTFDNCFLIDHGGVSVWANGSGTTIDGYHNSAYSAVSTSAGFFKSSGACVSKAGIAQTVGACYTSMDAASDYNVSSDTSAAGTHKWTGQTDMFAVITGGSESLALAAWAQNRYASADYTASAGGDPATDLIGTSRAAPFNAGCAQHTTDLSSTLLTGLLADYEFQEATASKRHNYYSGDTTHDGQLDDHASVTQAGGHTPTHTYAAGFAAASSQYLQPALTIPGLRRGNNDFTIECWIYLTDQAATYAIFDNLATSGNKDWELAFVTGTNLLNFQYSDTGGNVTVTLTNGGTVAATTWTHVVITYTASTKTVAAYVNNGTADTNTSANAKAAVADGTPEFGRGNAANYYNGRLGPWRLWSSVLSSQDRTDLYNAGAGVAWPLTRPVAASGDTSGFFFFM